MPRETGGVTIVGPGRVGLSLAADLSVSRALGPVSVAGQGPEPPAFLSHLSGVSWLAEPRPSGPFLLFAVPDDALPEAIEAWARLVSGPGAPVLPDVVAHTSGARDASVLAPFSRIGTAVVAWHPLVAVAGPGPDAFRGASIGLEGDETGLRFGERLAASVGGRPLRLSAGGRGAYHAAAVFASNYLVACLGVALDLLREASGGRVGEADLAPLARSALRNVERHGLGHGATGPLSRGDLSTIDGHLEALDPPRAALYRALGRELLDLVREGLDPATAAALEDRLAETP
ncbi:MAG: Rossmann-like and DUF2520 domain-containing protein [Gemmatimonadota bacterium]